jgi:HKD family nuclease
MDSVVISDHLKHLLDGYKVKAAVFTTYTFESDFFEQEVIPLLLPGDIPFSSDHRVKEFQVREALREAKIDLEVFYDLQMFYREGQRSPAMEYLCHGVHRGNNAFHAKALLILVFDQETKEEYLLVGAGSNNLSQAGWWDNIECQHWETVVSGEASLAFINRLREDIDYLKSEQHVRSNQNTSALEHITAFLQNCKASNNAAQVPYYGIASINRGINFQGFLKQQTNRLLNYDKWTLEIISPFFAEHTHNTEHEFFFKLGVTDIHLLLPTDQEGTALCHQDYFKHIEDAERIRWAKWAPDVSRQLGMTGQHFRRLHAKMYHFYNGKQSWIFVGSVNFSHKAMYENIEAGFFQKLPKPTRLLQPIDNTAVIDNFQPPTELSPGTEKANEAMELPQVHLAYDWISRTLTGVSQHNQCWTIKILTAEGSDAIQDWEISNSSKVYDGAVDALEKLLKNGSLVRIVGHESHTAKVFASHMVMLQQTGWSHKPMDLPTLTAEQILAVYADMAPERRQLLLMNAHIRKLVLEGTAGEMTVSMDDIVSDQFFSEYAEIFHAFRRLSQRLKEALNQENYPLIDYYLTGKGMDSLPTLMEHTTTPEDNIKPVTTYLLLLCVREIYRDKDFQKRPLIFERLAVLEEEIVDIKRSDKIKLEDNSPTKRSTFFQWFEKQFHRKYRFVDDAQ